jgi:hypothetical protein
MICSLYEVDRRIKIKTCRDSYVPGKVVHQYGWKDIANVYDYLWGFLTWSYKFSLLAYCTMVLQE